MATRPTVAGKAYYERTSVGRSHAMDCEQARARQGKPWQTVGLSCAVGTKLEWRVSLAKARFNGRMVRFDRFVDFITTEPRAGCGWPLEKVEALIKDDAETLAMWHEATKIGQGIRTDLVGNSNQVKRPKNSKGYQLCRLEREAPELFQRVVDGKLSANAAAIEAGFRKKLTPFQQIEKLLPKLSKSEKGRLRQMLECE